MLCVLTLEQNGSVLSLSERCCVTVVRDVRMGSAERGLRDDGLWSGLLSNLSELGVAGEADGSSARGVLRGRLPGGRTGLVAGLEGARRRPRHLLRRSRGSGRLLRSLDRADQRYTLL